MMRTGEPGLAPLVIAERADHRHGRRRRVVSERAGAGVVRRSARRDLVACGGAGGEPGVPDAARAPRGRGRSDDGERRDDRFSVGFLPPG